MSKRRSKTLVPHWVAMMVLLLCLMAPRGQASLLSSFTYEQFQEWNAGMGGSGSCGTGGTYDAATFIWTQSGPCNGSRLFTPDQTLTPPGVYTQASLAALVDNSGNVLGGAFSLYGRTEELGIDTLLATGTLLDAFYGPTPTIYMPVPEAQALIQLKLRRCAATTIRFDPLLAVTCTGFRLGYEYRLGLDHLDRRPWLSAIHFQQLFLL